MRQLVHKIQHTWERYERHISSVTLLTGFVFDNLTLRRIDQFFDIAVLLFYVALSGLCIIILSVLDRRESHSEWRFWIIQALQFAFGGLFSAFFIFYTRSASLAASWPFLLVLLFLMVGNEIFKARYSIFILRLGTYAFILLNYVALYFPVITRRIGDDIFILSEVISLFMLWVFLHILRALLPKTVYDTRKKIMLIIGSMYAIITLLYFTNIIPPIPLALKESGVYHSLRHIGNDYEVQEEPRHWYSFLRRTVLHVHSGQTAYVATAIFAPQGLQTTVVHEWQYYDQTQKKWTTLNKIPFSIIGGREGGFRGYSLKTNITPGKWRVNITTERGQLIGRETFYVELITPDTQVPLVTKVFL